MTDTRIVTTTYRYKRPAKKRKAVAIAGPAIVRKRSRANAAVPPPDEPEPATHLRPMTTARPSRRRLPRSQRSLPPSAASGRGS
jgi:hypothetical protein